MLVCGVLKERVVFSVIVNATVRYTGLGLGVGVVTEKYGTKIGKRFGVN